MSKFDDLKESTSGLTAGQVFLVYGIATVAIAAFVLIYVAAFQFLWNNGLDPIVSAAGGNISDIDYTTALSAVATFLFAKTLVTA